MFSDPAYFTDRSGRQTLSAHCSNELIPRRLCFLRAAGTMAFMHFQFFEQSPSGVLPALFLFLLGGRPAFDFDPTFLAEIIDEQTLRHVIQWNEWALNKPVLPTSPIYSVLMAADLDVCLHLLLCAPLLISSYQPTSITAVRSQQEHDGIHRSLLFSAALGMQDLTYHPDANALLSGLNLRLRPAGSGQVPLHVLDVSDIRGSSTRTYLIKPSLS